MASFHRLLQLVAVVLPQGLKRALFRRAFGWKVADDAHVGLSYIGADMVTLGPGAHIGHFNIVRGIRTLELGRRAYIKDFNHIFGATLVGTQGERSFRLGDDSNIMSRHFFDVCGSITIGSGCLVGGRGTQVYTHSIVTRGGEHGWKVDDMVIGDRALVYASAVLVHCHVPPGAIVAAGAVLTKSYEPELDQQLLIAGNPAIVVRRQPISANGTVGP